MLSPHRRGGTNPREQLPGAVGALDPLDDTVNRERLPPADRDVGEQRGEDQPAHDGGNEGRQRPDEPAADDLNPGWRHLSWPCRVLRR